MQNFIRVVVGASMMMLLVACGDTTSETLQSMTQDTETAENPILKTLETNTTIVQKETPSVSREENSSTQIALIPADKHIFIIGDSTAFNRANGIDLGWGSHVKDYMVHPENAHNLASGGQSSRTYKHKNGWRDWNKTKTEILKVRENSEVFLLIQFGSNDRTDSEADAMNATNKTTMPGRNNTFYTELKEYIDWSRDNDITPVLVTPIHIMYKESNGALRNEFKRPFGNYIETMRMLAKDENVLLLDFAKKSYATFNAYPTKEEVVAAFGVPAENGKRQDYTHYSLKGAIRIGGWVKELSCMWDDKTLCAQFKE
jgi:lysophospholipase L1-like esterase